MAPPADRVDVPDTDERFYDDATELPDASTVGDDARTEFGQGRFGSIWIDRSVKPAVLRVNVVRGTPDEATRFQRNGQSKYKNSQRVVLRSVKYSNEQILGFKDSAKDILFGTGKVFEVGLDAKANRLQITVAEITADLRKRLLEKIPADAFNLEGGYRSEFTSGKVPMHTDRRWAENYYESGLWTRILGKPGSGIYQDCTTGFAMQTRDYQIDVGTTAGHCSHGATHADTVALGQAPYPIVTVGQSGENTWIHPVAQSVPVDAMRFRLDTANPTVAGANYPYVNTGGGSHRRVYGYFADSALTYDTRLCFQGITSGASNCGNLRQADVLNCTSSEGVLRCVDHGYEVSNGSQRGDSGGPVYQVVGAGGDAKAAGLMSAESQYTTGRYVFSSIERIMTELNSGLYCYGC